MFKFTVEKTKTSLNDIERVLEASGYLKKYDNNTELSLSERMKNVKKVKEILMENKNLPKLDLYKSSMRENLRLTNNLHSSCIMIWSQQVQWYLNKNLKGSWRAMMKITGAKEDIGQSVLVLQYFEILNSQVKLFAKQLMDSIIKPIIIQNVKVDVTKSESTSSMIISMDKDETTTKIQKLKEVFRFLNSTLPAVDIQFMSYLGSYASQPLLDILKNIKLFNDLPVQYDHLNKFQVKRNEVLELNTYLSGLGNI